jgi:hypothetical protein
LKCPKTNHLERGRGSYVAPQASAFLGGNEDGMEVTGVPAVT